MRPIHFLAPASCSSAWGGKLIGPWLPVGLPAGFDLQEDIMRQSSA